MQLRVSVLRSGAAVWPEEVCRYNDFIAHIKSVTSLWDIAAGPSGSPVFFSP